jgi:hypothetical protein
MGLVMKNMTPRSVINTIIDVISPHIEKTSLNIAKFTIKLASIREKIARNIVDTIRPDVQTL